MALVKYGGGIVGMSGKVAGNVFARNRYGNYVRSLTKPTNPNTARQQVIKGIMAQLSARWSQTLTAAQRSEWNDYAGNVTMKNRLGENVQLSGFNHYLRSNSILLDLQESAVDDGPVIFELPEKDPLFAASISESTQLVSVTFDTNLDWVSEDGAFLYLICGRPQNPQRNFFSGPWKGYGQIDGDSASPPTSPQTFTDTFTVNQNQKQWIQARIVRADGRVSEPFQCSAIVGA